MNNFDLNSIDFDSLSKKESNARVRIRLLALSHLKDGKNSSEVARMLKISAQSVRFWLLRFHQESLDGLKDKQRSGRPYALDPQYHQALKDEILQRNHSSSGGSLTGLDIVDLIQEKWNVSYSLSGVYDLLRILNMSWISARSKHPKQDKEAQDQFKKTFPIKSMH